MSRWLLALIAMGVYFGGMWAVRAWLFRVPRLVKRRDVPRLASLLREFYSPKAHARAIAGLGEVGGEQALPPLTWALQRQEPAYALPAIRALERVAAGSAATQVQQAAVWALVAHWVASKRQNEKEVDDAIMEALVRIGALAVDSLVRVMGNPAVLPFYHGRAAILLGRIGDPRAIPPLRALIGSSTGWEHDQGLLALAKLAPADSLDALLPMLKADQDIDTRLAAVTALGDLDPQAAYPHLVALLGDRYPRVVKKAIESLARSRNPELVPLLLKKLTDTEEMVRSAAWETLRALGVSEPPRDVLVDEAKVMLKFIHYHKEAGKSMWAFGTRTGKAPEINDRDWTLNKLREKYALASDYLSRIVQDAATSG